MLLLAMEENPRRDAMASNSSRDSATEKLQEADLCEVLNVFMRARNEGQGVEAGAPLRGPALGNWRQIYSSWLHAHLHPSPGGGHFVSHLGSVSITTGRHLISKKSAATTALAGHAFSCIVV